MNQPKEHQNQTSIGIAIDHITRALISQCPRNNTILFYVIILLRNNIDHIYSPDTERKQINPETSEA